MKTIRTLPSPSFPALVVVMTLGLASTVSAVNVTYRVNMSIQEATGHFNPATDTVFVSGNFSDPGWQQTSTDGATNYTLTASVGDPDVYEGTFATVVATGDWDEHKFVINRNGTFGTVRWEEAIGNRYFQIPATDTNLPVVFFDDVDTLPSVRDVTFQVDMSVQIALTNFNPATDFLNVAGTFNDWSTTASELSQSVTNTNVWVGTFSVEGVTSNVSTYKFVMSTFSGGEIWEANGVGPYGPNGDRGIVLAATDQTLPVACFNNQCSLPYENPVTFQVNMAAQLAYGNFTNGLSTVTAAGTFNDWDPAGFVLTNSPGNPYVYQGTTNVLGTEGQSISYKYVIGGGTTNELWEDNIADRTFNQATNSQTLDTVFFDNVDDLGTLTTSPAGGNQVDVSWTPGALVRLQLSTSLPNSWVDVPSTTGASNATVTLPTDGGYFRLIGP